MADYHAPTVVRPGIPVSAISQDPIVLVPARQWYLVHVYTVIRIKVAVDAPDHRSAMRAADTILFGNGLPVALRPVADAVLEAEYADEITGYLVDEADDEGFDRSRSYGPDHEPDRPPAKERAE